MAASEKKLKRLEAQPDPGEGLLPDAAARARKQHLDRIDQASEDYVAIWTAATDPQKLHADCVWERARRRLLGKAIAERRTDEDRKFDEDIVRARAERQAEVDAKRKLAELKDARKHPAHPQAESITAAVLADPSVFADMRGGMREAQQLSEFGRLQTVMTNEPILELEDVGLLVIVMHLLREKGSIPIGDWRAGGKWPQNSDLPPTPRLASRLSHLAGNGLLSLARDESGGMRVSYGTRTREIAAKWAIVLPEPEQAKERAAAIA